MSPRRVLVLGAWAPEIAPLAPLARKLARRSRGPRLFLDTVGVGPVDAALGTEAAIARHGSLRAKNAGLLGCIFVGTAGVYPAASAPTVGGAALVHRLHLVSTAALRGDGYWPAPARRASASSPDLLKSIAAAVPALPAADLYNTLVITSAAALARRLGRARLDDEAAHPKVENLEAFAVARACARRDVPFAAVVGISNVVGPDAHATWKAMAPVASAAVAQALETWLATLPG